MEGFRHHLEISPWLTPSQPLPIRGVGFSVAQGASSLALLGPREPEAAVSITYGGTLRRYRIIADDQTEVSVIAPDLRTHAGPAGRPKFAAPASVTAVPDRQPEHRLDPRIAIPDAQVYTDPACVEGELYTVTGNVIMIDWKRGRIVLHLNSVRLPSYVGIQASPDAVPGFMFLPGQPFTAFANVRVRDMKKLCIGGFERLHVLGDTETIEVFEREFEPRSTYEF